jgi:hypothetical protein
LDGAAIVVAEDADAADDEDDGDGFALNCDNDGLIDVLSNGKKPGCTDADMV